MKRLLWEKFHGQLPNWTLQPSLFRVTLGRTVKGACPVGSCRATMEEAVHSPPGGLAAPVLRVMADPNVSVAVRTAAPPSPVEMEGCALKRPASRSFTASVPMALRENDANRASDLPTSWQWSARDPTVTRKPTMASVTTSVTYCPVTGTVVIALWLQTPGPTVKTLSAGVSSITASVMTPVIMQRVYLTILNAQTKRKCASEFIYRYFPIFFLHGFEVKKKN